MVSPAGSHVSVAEYPDIAKALNIDLDLEILWALSCWVSVPKFETVEHVITLSGRQHMSTLPPYRQPTWRKAFRLDTMEQSLIWQVLHSLHSLIDNLHTSHSQPSLMLQAQSHPPKSIQRCHA